MTATAALTAVHTDETFGLPPEASHLIAKLRLLPPELLATITHKDAA